MVKIDNTGAVLSTWPQNYGDLSLGSSSRDQGGHNVIEVQSGGTYYYLSTGVHHPGQMHCFNANQHDVYDLKISATGSNQWSSGCDLDDGLNYGGSKNDEGYCAVQTCDGGYLVAADETSNGGVYDVTCNNGFNTSDAWLLKLSSSGTEQWDESLGDAGDDEAHSIKKCPDGSYIFAGEIWSATYLEDFYVVKFELSAACAPPNNLNAAAGTYCETLSWNMDPCVPRYVLQYRKSGGSWNTVDPATSPYVVYNTVAGSTTYNWRVISYCSPNNGTATNGPSNFTLAYCSGTPSCASCVRLGATDSASYDDNLLTAYPNPSDGNFEISLQLPQELNTEAKIEILDQAGKVVQAFNELMDGGLINKDISGVNLPSGFYWVKVSINSVAYLTKLIIEK